MARSKKYEKNLTRVQSMLDGDFDKKIQSGNLNFILLEDIGITVIQDNINRESIINILETL